MGSFLILWSFSIALVFGKKDRIHRYPLDGIGGYTVLTDEGRLGRIR
jgi:hypothetical protein